LQDPVKILKYSERRLRKKPTSKMMIKELNNEKV
jgi:hypothetical protein